MSYGMLHHSNPYMDERADEPTKYEQVQNDEWPTVEEQLQYWRDKDYELEAGRLFLPRQDTNLSERLLSRDRDDHPAYQEDL